jgi:hypothetical protein
MHRTALEEHFCDERPVAHWRGMVTMIPEPFIEKILPVLTDVGDGRLEAMTQVPCLTRHWCRARSRKRCLGVTRSVS